MSSRVLPIPASLDHHNSPDVLAHLVEYGPTGGDLDLAADEGHFVTLVRTRRRAQLRSQRFWSEHHPILSRACCCWRSGAAAPRPSSI